MGSGGQGEGGRSPLGLQLGFQALGSREAFPARKPLRRCPHYITDIPATEPASLMRGASLNAKQDEAPSGRAAEPLLSAAASGHSEARGRFQTPTPRRGVGGGGEGGGGEWAAAGFAEEEGRGGARGEGAGGRGVKCGISCRAVVPDSLPSVRGSV